VVVGNLTLDDVVLPDGTTQMASIGGNSLYAALGARPWQASVGIVTRKGDDFPGDLVGRLQGLDIATAGIVSIPGPTVRNWVVYEADGERHWIYRTPRERSLEVAVRPGDLPVEWLPEPRPPVVHIAAMPIDAAEGVVDAVRRLAPHAIISLDTHEDYVGRYRSRLRALAGRVDAFLPSRSELAELVRFDDPVRALEQLSPLPTPIIVIKMGEEGVLVWDRPGDELTALSAAPGPVVDVTGAGDAFCGGFAAGLSLGDKPLGAARRGAVSAAFAVGSFGSPGLAAVRPAQAAARLRSRPPVSHRLPAPTSKAVPTVPGADRGIKSRTEIMEEEIAMIPQLLERQLRSLATPLTVLAKTLQQAGARNLFLTGCGDSAMAGAASTLAFRRHSGMHVEAVEALELARYRIRYLPADSTVVCLSYSGKVGRTIEAALQARRFGHRVVAITGDPESPLAREATHIVPITVPTLGYSPGTSTYVAMLFALLQLAVTSTGLAKERELLQTVPDLTHATIEGAQDTTRRVAERFVDRPQVMFLGAGPNFASAAFGAAKLYEGPQMLAAATNLEEWAHGEYFVSGPSSAVVVVAPLGASFDRAAEVLSELDFIEADSVLVSDDAAALRMRQSIALAAGLPEEFSPILAAPALSLLAYELTKARGQASFEFASPEAAQEHYETIHRATVGEPG
jgi:fructoselysine-6-P-deglycase FrlB-like protein/sugar/nucleoside kinase (ribokinase family)